MSNRITDLKKACERELRDRLELLDYNAERYGTTRQSSEEYFDIVAELKCRDARHKHDREVNAYYLTEE